ncbi:SMI1/KNR4 family protein [Clostridium lundense]|uniref:SMI1/KNR4 family protein n=1 Tax=Clostridium lundense TaxID=319475 RepID=UPI000484F2AA|nr:SMI1/KNR4 family protein [Clostridium lundense]
MNNEIFRIIKEEFDMVPEAFGGEVNQEEIDKCKELIDTELPEDYMEFICRFGCGVVGTTVILGLGEAQFVSTPSFVEQTIRFRHELPSKYKNFVVVGVDGQGSPIGFNSPSKEIILFDHNSGEEVYLAVNFSEYLRKACYNELNIQF